MIRVILVHSMPQASQALVRRLNQEADLQVVGCATTSHELLATLPQVQCDLFLLDVNLANAPSASVLRQVTQQAPTVKVILRGLVDHPAVILPYLQAGAVGYLTSEASIDELVQGIRYAYKGEAVLSSAVAGALIHLFAKLSRSMKTTNPVALAESELDTRLTKQQHQVLGLIEQGYSNQEIADTLLLGLGTVKNHAHAIMRKLKVKNRREAATLKRSGFV